MELITLNKENLLREHICCAISNNNDCQVASKKAWLAQRLDDGLIFTKANVRGKCFIEYLPARAAWAPVNADGWMYIDCLWVSGQFKGQGYSNLLLNACIQDSREKGMQGLVILSSKKKLGFLADPGYLRHKGFVCADTAAPYFELMALPFGDALPSFRPAVGEPYNETGLTLFYTDQCPYTAKYVPLLSEVAARRGVPMRSVHITEASQAQALHTPYTTFSLYLDGKFITHEIQSEKKFERLLEQHGA